MDTWLQVAAGLALLSVGGEGVIRGAPSVSLDAWLCPNF
jgi:hypothetical protein